MKWSLSLRGTSLLYREVPERWANGLIILSYGWCTQPRSVDGWARACLTYGGVVIVDAACSQSNRYLLKDGFFRRLPACCYFKMDPLVARRVLSRYVYRDWSNWTGRLPTAMITFSSIYKSPAAGQLFDISTWDCITKTISLGRVQVASQ